MKTSQTIFLGLALFLVVEYSNANHLPNCGLGPGSDACGCSKLVVKAAKPVKAVKFADPYVIREAVAYKAPAAPPCGSAHAHRPISGPSVTDLLKHNGPVAPRFRPVGDLCSCKTTIADVVPAYVPKPACTACAQKAAAYEYSDPHHYGHVPHPAPVAELNILDDDCLSFDEQEEIYNAQPAPAAPADPVSLALAYSLNQRATKIVPEGGLTFGPKTTPIDGSVRKVAVNVPEERLLIVERPVVELKHSQKSAVSASYNELVAQQEALEQRRLQLEAEAEAAHGHDPFISYQALGYAPVTPTKNAFVNTVVSDPAVADVGAEESGCGPVGKPVPGYVSGNVIVRTAPEPAPESDPADYYSDGSYEEDSGDLDPDQYDIYSNEATAPCDGANAFLARLRASAQHQHPAGCGCGCGR